MARELFVTPQTDKLPLFDDGLYYIEVKRQLNAGEQNQISAGAFKSVTPTVGKDGPSVSYDIDLEVAAFRKVLVYLVDWNLTRDGKTLAIENWKAKYDALKALHPDVYAEIERAVDAHVAAHEKKVSPGSPTPDIT